MKTAVRQVILSSIALDADAINYIRAVEAADGAPLEQSIMRAINNFVIGCKADNTWDAIQDCCILSGARTLSGALVPLKGTAPSNINFVSADYNRATGLIGNGSNKELNTNKNHNTYPQNNLHFGCWVSSGGASDSVYMGAGLATNESGASNLGILVGANRLFFRNQQTVADSTLLPATGFLGTSRNNSSGFFAIRQAATIYFPVLNSQTPLSANIFVFSSGAFRTNARIAFYSIGTALDLALLNNRITTLINSFGGLT